MSSTLSRKSFFCENICWLCNSHSLTKPVLNQFQNTHSYTSIAVYWFLDAILKSWVLWESVDKLWFVNKQVKLFQNHQFCIKNPKVAILVLHSVWLLWMVKPSCDVHFTRFPHCVAFSKNKCCLTKQTMQNAMQYRKCIGCGNSVFIKSLQILCIWIMTAYFKSL